MATAMQEKSTAETMCRQIIAYKLEKNDADLWRYLQVWERERNDALKASAPNQYCFGVMAAARGLWAASLATEIANSTFPETRRWLATHIVDGWLGAENDDDIDALATVIATWPEPEAKMIADVLRNVARSRNESSERHAETARRLARLYLYMPRLIVDDTLWRMVFRLLGSYAPIDLIGAYGKELYHDLEREKK